MMRKRTKTTRITRPLKAEALTLGAAVLIAKRERDDWKANRDKSLQQRVEAAIDYFGADTQLAAISVLRIQTYAVTLSDQGLKPATVNRYLAALSAVLDHARRTGRTDHAPAFPWRKETEGRMEWLTYEQEDDVARALRPHEALVLRVLCATGLRAGEFWGLEAQQVEKGWIRLWRTKSGRPRSVPIDPALSLQLRQAIEGKSLPSYLTFYRALKVACSHLGLSPKLSVHSLRHTTGTRLAAKVAGPVVQKFLGHASYETTQRYVHLADDELQRASEALRR